MACKLWCQYSSANSLTEVQSWSKSFAEGKIGGQIETRRRQPEVLRSHCLVWADNGLYMQLAIGSGFVEMRGHQYKRDPHPSFTLQLLRDF